MQYPVIAVMLQIISESTNINGVANQVKVIRCRRRFVYELKFCRQISISTVIVHNQPEISVAAPDIQVIGFTLRQIAADTENAAAVELVYLQLRKARFLYYGYQGIFQL